MPLDRGVVLTVPRRNDPSRLDRDELSPRDIARFMRHIEVAESGCWIWTGYRNRKGYGQFKLGGKARWAHRVSLAIFEGAALPHMHVDHTCCNTSCVNPACLRHEHESTNSPRHAVGEVPF